MRVYLSRLAERRLDNLLLYLENEWGDSVKAKFLLKVKDEFKALSSYPYRCKKTETFSDLYDLVITKHTSAIFRILENTQEIEIVTFFDNRQDPEMLKKELEAFFGKRGNQD